MENVKIYKITNTKNGFVYIGQTSQSLEERWENHIKKMKGNDDRLLYKDMREFGIEAFSIEQIDECAYRHRFITEEYWTKKFIEEKYPVYNINLGCHNGLNAIQRMAEARKQRGNDIYQTENFKKRISTVTKGENNPLFGKKDDKAVNGRLVVAYYDKERTQIAHTFVSVKMALKFLKIKSHTMLNKACREGSLYKNYYWSKEWKSYCE